MGRKVIEKGVRMGYVVEAGLGVHSGVNLSEYERMRTCHISVSIFTRIYIVSPYNIQENFRNAKRLSDRWTG